MTDQQLSTEPTPTSFDEGEQRELFWEALGNTVRPYAGWIFYGFGCLFVLLGYVGISGEAVVAKQLPYLISGGIGGIVLAVLGAYFLGIEELHKDSGRLDRMEQQLEDLHLALLSRADAPPPPADPRETARLNGEDDWSHLVAVTSGTSFHRDTCALVLDKEIEILSDDDVQQRGLAPCKVCEPVLVP